MTGGRRGAGVVLAAVAAVALAAGAAAGSAARGSAASLGVASARLTTATFAGPPPADTTPPHETAMEMRDTNGNGKVDRVVVSFDESIVCDAPCTSPWTLANVPSGGALSSVAVSGSTATLAITEGAGAASTAVGSFTVALAASASGVRDAAGNRSSFAATAPADKAGPVPLSLAVANRASGTAGKPEEDDTVTVRFSEPLAAASVCSGGLGAIDGNNSPLVATITDGTGGGNDRLTVSVGSPTCGGAVHFGTLDLGSTGYSAGTFQGNGSNATMLALAPPADSLVLTLGTAQPAQTTVSASLTATFTPDAALADASANTVVGTVSHTGVHF